MGFIVAIATDDGNRLTAEHFGDAKQFVIYELTRDGYRYLKTIDNTTQAESEEHEHHHGDPNKAQGIGQLMRSQGVQVLAGQAFGPNIVRMNPQFVVVLVSDPTAEQAISRLQQYYDMIEQRWLEGEYRKHLNLKLI